MNRLHTKFFAKRAVKASDDRLFGHVKSLRRYAMALVGEAADADDLVQETLKRALTYVRDSGEIDNLRGYLFAILRNVRADRLSRESREAPTVPLADSALQVSSPAPQLLHIECLEMARALRKLPEEQREVLLLVALEGATYQTAAQILGVPVGTIMSRLFRGREQLRQRMAGERQSKREQAS